MGVRLPIFGRKKKVSEMAMLNVNSGRVLGLGVA